MNPELCATICLRLNEFVDKHSATLTNSEYDLLVNVAWFVTSLKDEKFPRKRVKSLCNVAIRFFERVDNRNREFMKDVRIMREWLISEMEKF